MATQGKGILGSPHGKIGSVHFYDRLGQSIVQSNSIPKDAYRRRWNLLKWQLSKRLTFYFISLSLAQKNVWLSGAPPFYSGLQWFLEYTLDNIFKSKLSNIQGQRYEYLLSKPFVEAYVFTNWGSSVIYLSIPFNNSIWSNYGKITGNIEFRDESGILQTSYFSHVVTIPQLIKIPIVASKWVSADFLSLSIVARSPFKVYNRVMLDVYNSDTVF